MTFQEIQALIKDLKESGVSHFKCGDLELSFAPGVVQSKERHTQPVSLKTPPKDSESEVPHIVHEMKTILTMSDEELVDKVFPLPTEEVQ